MLAPQAPRKPFIQPSVPMKPVYWSKVVNPLGLLNPLLWDQLEEVEVPGVQLEELFAKAAPKKVQPKEEKKEEEVQKSTQHEKAKPTRVIDLNYIPHSLTLVTPNPTSSPCTQLFLIYNTY